MAGSGRGRSRVSRAVLSSASAAGRPTSPYLCGVRSDLDHEVRVEGGGDPIEQRNVGMTPPPKWGERGLGYPGLCGEFDLGQAERQPAVADGVADQVGALGFGVAFAVVALSRRWRASCS